MKNLQQELKEFLLQIGENPERAELLKTPQRVMQMYQSFLKGYHILEEDPLGVPHKIPTNNHNDLIVVDQIPFCSLCEHHLIPFYGVMHVSYIPDKQVLGLSRFSSYIDHVSAKLHIQEKLGVEIIQGLFEKIKPKAIKIKIVGTHCCLIMLGKKASDMKMITTHFRGDHNLEHNLTESLQLYS